jgi:hypothetical protein
MIWLDKVSFHGGAPMRPDWIAQIVVDDGTDRLDMFANVKSCEQKSPQRCDIVVSPFGLAGSDAATWQRMVDRARGPRRP